MVLMKMKMGTFIYSYNKKLGQVERLIQTYTNGIIYNVTDPPPLRGPLLLTFFKLKISHLQEEEKNKQTAEDQLKRQKEEQKPQAGQPEYEYEYEDEAGQGRKTDRQKDRQT